MFAIRAQSETVADFDTVPQLHRAARRIDAKQAAWNRLVIAERIEVDSSGVYAAVRVGGEIVHADGFAFPCGEQIAALARLLAPMNQAAAGEHEPAAAIEDHPADALSFRDERFDIAAAISPGNSAVRNVGEVEPVALVNAWRFQQTIAAREHLEFHRS